MNKVFLPLSLFFAVSILGSVLCRAGSVRELLQNPDVVAYLNANSDQKSRLNDAVDAVNTAVDNYNLALQNFKECLNARPIAPGTIGGQFEAAAIDLNIQLARNTLNDRKTELQERRNRLEEICEEIRSNARKNPPLNRSEAGPTLDDAHSQPSPTPVPVGKSSPSPPAPPKQEAQRPLPPAPQVVQAAQNTVQLLVQAETQLTSVYSQIRSRLTASEKETLKKDEVQWIKTKDSLPAEERLSSVQNRIRALQERYGMVNPTSQSTAGDKDTSSLVAAAEQDLTAVYTRIRKRLSPDQKEDLKQDEIKWIAKKDSMPAEQRLAEIKARIQALQQQYGD